MSKRRTFSKETKLCIIKEAKENGVNRALLKHSIYPVTYCSWKNKYEQMGETGFRHGMTTSTLKRNKTFRKGE